ncbi:WG repeat-containing protein [Paenibacillus alkaliterrae]|uniref:WG repeat-containing protein n=1 Tax=Paenibacillus alkaliterrae TaxID=320909 RepID=UPI001F48FE07|nr:WG repeat-containing protein [Paenibacillus alkaliterrae]MCF2939278.1 WG repeat-containing protein [Paenibacillus alkaliterrae]
MIELLIPLQFDGYNYWDNPGEFHEGRASILLDDKYGFIDQSGKVVIAPQFMTAPTNFSKGLAGGIRDFSLVYIDDEGNTVVDTGFNGYFGVYSEDGLAAVMRDGLWGYINQAGSIVIDFQYEEALDFTDGLAAVKKEGQWGYIDRNGQVIIPIQYSAANEFSEGVALVSTDGAMFGYINRVGELLSGYEFFNKSSSFHQGLAKVHIIGNQDKFGFVSLVDEELAPTVQENAKPTSELNAFGGKWSTPGSDELAFNLSFTDKKNGVITHYSMGQEYPNNFGYIQSADNSVILRVGDDEQNRTTVKLVLGGDSLTYEQNGQTYNLERSGGSQVTNEAAETSLIDGFKGKWCDANSTFCIQLFFGVDSNGIIDYFKDGQISTSVDFKINYQEENYLELDAGGVNVLLTVDDDGGSMEFFDALSNVTMTRKE